MNLRLVCRVVVTVIVSFGMTTAARTAPEPARLDGDLWGKESWAPASYVNTEIGTRVVRWPGTWAVGTWGAGTPCSTWDASEGDIVTTVIEAQGNYRRCVEPRPAPPSAPEAARVSETLAGDDGTQAAARLINSGAATSVVKWPATLTSDTTLDAGMRCSPVDLEPGQEANWIIQINGDYRKCVDPMKDSPEPARVTEVLGGEAIEVAAVFVSNGMPTSVVRFASTWIVNPMARAGTPCSTIDLAAGQQTTQIIQANGNYRRCQ